MVDWGNWGDDYVSGDVGRAWNVALAGGVGYQFLKGMQVQLDLVAGPGPSQGDGTIKGLLRLELVGMIY